MEVNNTMEYQLPREELDFFVNFGNKQGSKPTSLIFLEKLKGIDVEELKGFYSKLGKDIEEKVKKEELDRIKEIKNPAEYERFLEELAGKLSTEKYESQIKRVNKSINKTLLYKSLERIIEENHEELKESEKRILKSYGTYPGDLTFLWFYFSANVHKVVEDMLKKMKLFFKKEEGFRKPVISNYMKKSKKVNFDISYGFLRLSAVSAKALDGSLEEEDLLNLEREIFDITSRIPPSISPSISYDSLNEREQKVVSALITV